MSNLVVDSSVAIKWFVAEPGSDHARGILDDYQAGKVTLIAPDLINAEMGNILWKKHVTQGLSADDARQVIQAFCALPIVRAPTISLLDAALDLAITHRRTMYDMLYVALSLREACPFVTADQRLVNALAAFSSNAVLLGKTP